jgi:alpha-beta hydrolase superfamily lysophospholipase
MSIQPLPSRAPREQIQLTHAGQLRLRLQCQAPTSEAAPRADVLYVHGASFGADLSVFFPFRDGSWADALNAAGFAAWGLDFAGYGGSERYPLETPSPWGRADSACLQLQRAMGAIRAGNGGRPLVLLAHSWGTVVAGLAAAAAPQDIAALADYGVRSCL